MLGFNDSANPGPTIGDHQAVVEVSALYKWLGAISETNERLNRLSEQMNGLRDYELELHQNMVDYMTRNNLTSVRGHSVEYYVIEAADGKRVLQCRDLWRTLGEDGSGGLVPPRIVQPTTRRNTPVVDETEWKGRGY